MARAWQLTMYCHDPAVLTAFWSEALGYVEQPVPDGFDTWEDALRAFGFPEDRLGDGGAIVDPDGAGPRVFFHRVPEDKPDQMNRLHLDVRVSSRNADEAQRRAEQAAERDRLIGLGATEVRQVDDLGEFWIIMRDPEGNEFCVT